MTILIAAITAVILAVALAGALYLVRILTLVDERLTSLTKKVNDLEAVTKGKRHTYATNAGIEDAQAVALDVLRYANDLETEASALRQRVAQQMEILGLVRQSPHSYNPDRPCGRRPEPVKEVLSDYFNVNASTKP